MVREQEHLPYEERLKELHLLAGEEVASGGSNNNLLVSLRRWLRRRSQALY